MIFYIDILKFKKLYCIAQDNKEEIKAVLSTIGFYDAAISIASFRDGLDEYCIPGFTKELMIECQLAYHPLVEKPIKNSIVSNKTVLITGSNASGKSTFLKMIAINAILGESIHTCCAKEWRMPYCNIYSSMSLRDDLSLGDSYYMVEIKSIKRVFDSIQMDEEPILCFVDEVLRGTNTLERIASSSQILKSISLDNSLCFAATHDIELTYMKKDLKRCRN